MRKDIAKVIVERPRHGHADGRLRPGRTRIVTDDDGEPLRAGRGGRAPVRAKPLKTKSLNENLAPLRRFLEGQVGRPWNKVYSEISEHLRPTSTVQQHVRDHVEDFVAVKTRMRAGEVLVVSKWGGECSLTDGRHRLYVHPRTGLLRKNQHWKSWSAARKQRAKREETERAARMRIIDAKTQLHRFGEIWWEVTLAKIKHHRRSDAKGRTGLVAEPFVDVVTRAKLSGLDLEERYGRAGVYASAKRQLSKADKKQHGLA